MDEGWRCCKTRVLTFDEFLAIPPCTIGEHSTVLQTPLEKPQEQATHITIPESKLKHTTSSCSVPILDVSLVRRPESSLPPSGPTGSESDDPSLSIPPGIHCRRRGCEAISRSGLDPTRRFDEQCSYHPGQPTFHEGSKGWTCCKRRVLEFEEFMRIEGCQQSDRHLFIGTRKNEQKEKVITNVRYVCYGKSSTKFFICQQSHGHLNRHDFYQTSTNVTASFYLKSVEKSKSIISFSPTIIKLDLVTVDSKRFKVDLPLHNSIKAAESTYKIMSSKLELTLLKTNGRTWTSLTNIDDLTM